MSQPIVSETASPDSMEVEDILPFERKPLTAADIILAKELLFDKYTLKDEYPYQDTVRSFKWDAIRKCLAFIENLQYDANRWAIFQNYKNVNREAPLVRKYTQNVYRRIADTLGVERYQSVPLYLPSDTLVPERYGRDGALVSFLGETGSFYRVSPVSIEGEWWVPRRYVKLLSDSTQFNHVVVVDRGDQNIAAGTSGRRYLGHPQHESGHYGHAPSAVRAGNTARHVCGAAEKVAYGVPERRFCGHRRLCTVCQSLHQRSLHSRGAGQRASHGDD